MGLQYADIDDAVLLTLQNLIKKGAFLDLQTDLTGVTRGISRRRSTTTTALVPSRCTRRMEPQ
jgi:hypothetical protein